MSRSHRARRTAVAAVATGVLLLAAGSAQAMIVIIGEQITNGTFGTGTGSLAGWTTLGTANTRAVTDVINAGGGNNNQTNVFDRGFPASDVAFFSSDAFAVLGDTSGLIHGTGGTNAPADGTHRLTQNFTLASSIGGNNVISYDLDVSLQSAFDGILGTTADVFQASLVLPDTSTILLFTQSLSSATGGQLSNNPFMTTLTGLAPGTYSLILNLVEAVQNGNNTTSAVGIDNVSITGQATVVPVPAALYLFGSALVGFAGFGRRRRHHP